MEHVELSVVVYEEGDLWIAQALEADIVATAESLAQLPRKLERAIIANLAANEKLGRSGLEGIPPAPDKFREKFEGSKIALQVQSSDGNWTKNVVGAMRVAA